MVYERKYQKFDDTDTSSNSKSFFVFSNYKQKFWRIHFVSHKFAPL